MKLLILAREPSYETGRLVEAAAALGHVAQVVSYDTLSFFAANGRASILAGGNELPGDFDALFVRNLNPFFSEVLTIAESFHRAGKVVVDARLATSTYISSKMYEGLRLAEAGVPISRTEQPLSREAAIIALEGFAFPLIMKGVHGGHGDHVYLAKDRSRAEQLIQNHPPGFFAIQAYVPTDHDIRILVVGGTAIGAMRRTILQGEFRANIAKGATGSPTELTPPLKALAEQACAALKREIAGVDILVQNGQPFVLEVNQHPGFAGFEAATGIDAAAQIVSYIAARIKKAP